MQLSIRLLLASWMICVTAFAKKQAQEYYQLTVYHFASQQQEQQIDYFLENAFLPALHQQGILHIGVFKPIANDTATDKRIYVLVPFKNLAVLEKLHQKLEADTAYASKGKAFLAAPYDKPAYKRKEVVLIRSFHLAPPLQLPQLATEKAAHVYELRSYEGSTEVSFKNKVTMFNEGGEISLFKRLGFNALFYGTVIAGANMPNLMYMTSFDNMEERNAHWKTFGTDAEWKKISGMAEYQHNVSKIDIVLAKAADYSDY